MSSSWRRGSARRRIKLPRLETLVVVVILVLAGSVAIYSGGLGWRPKSATVSVAIWNVTDQPIANASTLIYVFVAPSFNITSLPDVPANVSVEHPYFVWREVSVSVNYISPRAMLIIAITDIRLTENITADLGDQNVYLWVSQPPSGIGCSALLVLYGETPFGWMALGSSFQQWGNGANIYPGAYTDRYDVHAFYYILGLFAILIVAAIPLGAEYESVRKRYPFATFFVASIAVFLYTFAGSAWEILASGGLQVLQLLILCAAALFLSAPVFGFIWKRLMELSKRGPRCRRLERLVQQGLGAEVVGAPILIAVLASLKTDMHGSFFHLAGNLAYFLIIGCACESVANARLNKWRFTVFFILPLVAYSVLGFGLSGVIETMAILFAVYAVVNRELIAKSRVKIAMVFVSGLALYVFYGWLISSLTSVLAGYDLQLAIVHITATIVTVLLVGGLYWLGSRKRFRYASGIKEALDTVFKDNPGHID